MGFGKKRQLEGDGDATSIDTILHPYEKGRLSGYREKKAECETLLQELRGVHTLLLEVTGLSHSLTPKEMAEYLQRLLQGETVDSMFVASRRIKKSSRVHWGPFFNISCRLGRSETQGGSCH